jgi:transposase
MHVKNVPGRKTDTNDATWLAELLAHGLIRASFVPPAAIQALRDLTREKVSHVERIDKLLQAANLKLGSVLSDIVGGSGRAILDALAGGESDPERLADQVRTRIRASRAEVIEALRGRVTDHQRLLLRIHLGQIDAIDAAIAELDAELGERLDPFRDATARLTSIPGVGPLAAAVTVAEIGADMTRFPSAAHLISWAELAKAPSASADGRPAEGGLCPKNDESAGKRRSTKLRKGAPWLKTLLVQTAWCAVRVRGTYLRALFARLKARRGPRKAIIAVAAAILTAVHWMLKRGVAYQDLGADHFDRTDRNRLAARLARKLGELGFEVSLTRREAA